MADRIAQILQGHIDLARMHLAFLEGGLSPSFAREMGSSASFLGVSEGELRQRIDDLEAQLARHEARKA